MLKVLLDLNIPETKHTQQDSGSQNPSLLSEINFLKFLFSPSWRSLLLIQHEISFIFLSYLYCNPLFSHVNKGKKTILIIL